MKKIINLFLTLVIIFTLTTPISVSAATKPQKVKLSSVSSISSTSIKISWKKVSSVTGYVIYQSKGNNDFEKIKVISNNKTTSYTQKSLSSATKYTYYIKSYKKAKNGTNTYSSKSNSLHTCTKPTTPKISKISSPSTTTIKLQWNKVSRADGYVIYQKSGDTYKKIATVSKNKTSYTVKKLKSGKKYYFAIKAYKKANGKSINSDASKITSLYTKHTHKYSKKVTKPTCTKKGYTTYTCFCGDTYKSNYKSPKHKFVDYVCTECDTIDTDNAYYYLLNWVLENGEVDGGYVNYHVSSTLSINYNASGDYLYIADGYYNKYDDFVFTQLCLDNYQFYASVGDNSYDYVNGKINPKIFTQNSPIGYSKYNSTYYNHFSVAENARLIIVDMLTELEEFLETEELGITLADLGFIKF